MGKRRRIGERATGSSRRKRTPLRQAGNSETPEKEERNLERGEQRREPLKRPNEYGSQACLSECQALSWGGEGGIYIENRALYI